MNVTEVIFEGENVGADDNFDERSVEKGAEEQVLPKESSGANGDSGDRPAWNKPSEVAVEFGKVMDTHMWPALSESFRVSKPSSEKLSSPCVSKPSSDKLSSPCVSKPINNVNSTVPVSDNLSSPCVVPVSQPVGNTLNSTARPSMNSQPPPHWRHPHPRPMYSQPPTQGFRPHLRPNPHLRRDDFQHHRPRNQNYYQNFDAMQPIFVPPRPPFAPFITPPPPHVPPFGPPVGCPGFPPYAYNSAFQTVRPAPPMPPIPRMPMFPSRVPEPQDHLQLRSKIVNQINYYFSFENLIKDVYLRKHMDDQGWVPIELIAGFKKVSHLTNNVPLILDALRSSTAVEVEGNKIRKRGDWLRWIIPPSVQIPTSSGRRRSAN